VTDIEQKKDDNLRYYRIEIDMRIEYRGEAMPNETHVIHPIRAFINKAIKAYKNDYMLLGYDPNVYEFVKGESEEEDDDG